MDRLTSSEYANLLRSYELCFAWLFPELGFVALSDGFVVKGKMYKLEDVEGVELTDNHLYIYHSTCKLYLPIAEEMPFDIEPR